MYVFLYLCTVFILVSLYSTVSVVKVKGALQVVGGYDFLKKWCLEVVWKLIVHISGGIEFRRIGPLHENACLPRVGVLSRARTAG